MIHNTIYKTYIRAGMLLSVVFVFFFGIWSLFAYSWIYTNSTDYAEAYASILPQPKVYAATTEIKNVEPPQEVLATDPRNTENFDKKVAEVRRMLNGYKAPLAANAEDFVRAAEIYKIDYRLLPAISVVESSGGKHLFKPYNPFGWGKSGFPNFTAAIYDVSRGMSRYYARGADQPEEIARSYNPVTPNEWARKVRAIMGKMQKID